MKKIILIIVGVIIILILFLFVGKAPQQQEIKWGVTFSHKYAEELNLDWQETYLALIDDLGVREMRIASHWDVFEAEKGVYSFEILDWQIDEMDKRGGKVIPVIGMKVPRWPECYVPEWAKDLSKQEQQERILLMIQEIVSRYKDRDVIKYWQVENEPFLDFGDCPWYDKKFFKKEVEFVRSLDPDRPILVTESGELSTWFSGARIGDIVGTTMYRRTWWHRAGGFYFKYPIPPVHYHRKAEIIRKFFNKEVICAELQAEPWGPAPTYVISIEEQEKSMNLDIFKENIEYAKKTGLPKFYLWGGEWWYWMKKEHDQPQIWQEAKKLFK